MSTIFLHTLDRRLPKKNIKIQGNHENVEEIKVEYQNHNYSIFQDPCHQGLNAAPRNYLIPKIDMGKFDSKDPIAWIFQMEKLFDLHQVPTLQKVTLASLYLENDQFVWYQWLCERKKDFIVSCSIFTNELIAHYGDIIIKSNTLFSQLINLWQRDPIT
jgi:hypothetical protein